MCSLKGRINSIQTLGTLDGPGVRFTVFMQGCNLRCGCCHNPDTWNISEGAIYSSSELAEKAEKYKEYFGKLGGITLSGGEPLLQSDFAAELFKECHKKGINTCLDTSGSIINESTLTLLNYTDTVLLDIKYTNNEDYEKYVGCGIEKPLAFLKLLNLKEIPTVIRQVIIPGLNDNEENISKLAEIIKQHPCVKKAELLAFKKICQTKYDNLKIPFPFLDMPTPTATKVNALQAKLDNLLK